MWHVIDNSAESYLPYSPYVYVGNNTIRRVDTDGNDWGDIVKGAIVAVVDNATAGAVNLRGKVSYHDPKDFNRGQDVGDVVSIIAGGVEVGVGGGMAAGGVGVTVASGGTAAIAGLPTAAAGVLVAGHGVVMGASGANNLMMQKGRVNEGSNGLNEKHGDGGRAKTKAEKQVIELKEKLQDATGKEKQKINQKIKNIQETARQKAKGVEHSRSNKR